MGTVLVYLPAESGTDQLPLGQTRVISWHSYRLDYYDF